MDLSVQIQQGELTVAFKITLNSVETSKWSILEVEKLLRGSSNIPKKNKDG